jgi:diaminobutyrate-2-oxoglutarate transaminase
LAWWRDDSLEAEVRRKASIVQAELTSIATEHEWLRATARGRGLLQGLHTPLDGLATRITDEAFRLGLLMETSGGTASDVVKLMPPLTIDDAELMHGLSILRESVAAVAD